MSKYKVGDRVLLKCMVCEINNKYALNVGIKTNDETLIYVQDKCLQKDEKTYSDGLNDAWELARKIALYEENGGYSSEYIINAFGIQSHQKVLMTFNPQQALAKIEAYEKEQQIQVGDVVYIYQVANDELEDDSEAYGVVTGIYDGSDHYEVLMRNGDGVSFGKRQIKKTGRHIDIEHLLEQIRGDE